MAAPTKELTRMKMFANQVDLTIVPFADTGAIGRRERPDERGDHGTGNQAENGIGDLCKRNRLAAPSVTVQFAQCFHYPLDLS